jgi:hypothetical protein
MWEASSESYIPSTYKLKTTALSNSPKSIVIMSTNPQAIPVPRLEKTVSHSLSVSTSPTSTFHSPPSSFGGSRLAMRPTGLSAKPLKPFDTQDIKILLLENVNQTGKDILTAQGYQVEALKTSLPEDQLIEKIRYS